MSSAIWQCHSISNFNVSCSFIIQNTSNNETVLIFLSSFHIVSIFIHLCFYFKLYLSTLSAYSASVSHTHRPHIHLYTHIYTHTHHYFSKSSNRRIIKMLKDIWLINVVHTDNAHSINILTKTNSTSEITATKLLLAKKWNTWYDTNSPASYVTWNLELFTI